jgi:hypothetical protein
VLTARWESRRTVESATGSRRGESPESVMQGEEIYFWERMHDSRCLVRD